jgi:hypothetical protein
MMQAPINRKRAEVYRIKKREKIEKTPFNKELMNPDPNFIDERRVEKEENKGFFSKLLGI